MAVVEPNLKAEGSGIILTLTLKIQTPEILNEITIRTLTRNDPPSAPITTNVFPPFDQVNCEFINCPTRLLGRLKFRTLSSVTNATTKPIA